MEVYGGGLYSSDEDPQQKDEKKKKQQREICSSGCERPKSVCLCPYLPPSPLPTATQILILLHPHELRHKLSTAPLLPKCLLNSHTLLGRRLRPGSSPLLDSLLLSPPHLRPPALFLFPGTSSHPSVDLHHWAASHYDHPPHNLVLIVFDGTWNHAREMVSASLPFLSEFATRVSLGFDERVEGASVFDSELVLRKEPFLGCVSTIEAVARALRVLERDGVEIEERLISVLRAMARFQAANLKPLKPRVKLGKKKKEMKMVCEESSQLL
ncbi:hypothetical protein MRB53_031234 [Persea americana]|uniref:Uncharacterized protein n=1 Tax=Persea americana TaxID=3435 RepID=A0ACC2KNW1_PERAE|nr:hypothetical protein MRB53_031234 [Persea americana]